MGVDTGLEHEGRAGAEEGRARAHLGLEHPEADGLLGIHAQQQVGHPSDGHTALLVG